MDDPTDRFGMPESAFAAARESHRPAGLVHRVGMHVPTRGEVATLPPNELQPILDMWFWESPTELIPSQDQIRNVKEVLVDREDATEPDVRELIALCDDLLG